MDAIAYSNSVVPARNAVSEAWTPGSVSFGVFERESERDRHIACYLWSPQGPTDVTASECSTMGRQGRP